MLKRINQHFSGIPMTIFGGFFLILSLAFMLQDIDYSIDPAWIPTIISGFPLLYLAIWRIWNNKGMQRISSALLISIAMLAAIGIGDIFAAGEVAFIMAIGGILEEKTTERAKRGLESLVNLAPNQGRVLKADGEILMLDVKEIQLGDIIRVLPGESMPLDGLILSGHTSVDQSIMTGESLPVDKTVGDQVFCGTINRYGSIDIKTTAISEDSSLQKMIRLVREAEDKKAPSERIADRWASYLVPASLLLALITGLVTKDLSRAVTILVVFCPCALVLATPTAVMAAIGQASKHGVIIKSGEALEAMGKVDVITFDKTGTLTHGNLLVSDCHSLHQDYSDTDLARLAASLEQHSEHPLAKAVVDYTQNEILDSVEDFFMIPGRGVGGKIQGETVIAGNAKWLDELGIKINQDAATLLETFRGQGKAIICVAKDNILIGVLALSDVLRLEAKETISKLKEDGTKLVLLTGDHLVTAKYFANKLDIADVKAELLPDEKVSQIAELQASGLNVCMIGDGVNDAPALKTATVGVAMGAMGSDIAVDAADIALMSDDITKLPYLRRLSKATLNTIRFSITLSLLINFVAIILSIQGILNPVSGALVHNVGSVFVVLVAALLYDRKFD